MLVRSQAEDDHVSVEVVDPQVLARLLLAPILKQIAEEDHVLFLDLSLRHVILVNNVRFLTFAVFLVWAL